MPFTAEELLPRVRQPALHGHSDNPELIAVRMGAIDDDRDICANVHQFVDYAAPWHPILEDGLPRFPERMRWE